MIKDLSFGGLLREIRIRNKETLRKYSLARSFDCGNISKLERNLISPPLTIEQLMFYLEGLKYSEIEFALLKAACLNHQIAMAQRRFEHKKDLMRKRFK